MGAALLITNICVRNGQQKHQPRVTGNLGKTYWFSRIPILVELQKLM